MSSTHARHLRSAGRWSRSLAARRPKDVSPALAMGGPLHGGHSSAIQPEGVDDDRFSHDHFAEKYAAFSSSSALASSSSSSSSIATSSSVGASIHYASSSTAAPSSSFLASSSSAAGNSYPTSSSKPIVTTSKSTAVRMLPTDRYVGGTEWYPHNGNVDLRKWVSPEIPHRYISNGTCGERECHFRVGGTTDLS